MTVLAIQTNIPGRHALWLVNEAGRVIRRQVYQVEYHGAETLLAKIDDLLRANRLAAGDLEQIMVVRGPGPFTAVRTGLVVANTMAHILNLKIRSLVATQIITAANIKKTLSAIKSSTTAAKPYYGRRPNISKPKIRPQRR